MFSMTFPAPWRVRLVLDVPLFRLLPQRRAGRASHQNGLDLQAMPDHWRRDIGLFDRPDCLALGRQATAFDAARLIHNLPRAL